jgi:hypothetical protein
MWYSNLRKTCISRHNVPAFIHLSHRFTSASKPTAWKFLNVVSATSAFPFRPLRHQRNVYHVSEPRCEPPYASLTSHRNQETFYQYLLHWVLLPPKKRINNTAFYSTFLMHGRHFDYWNYLLNMRMRACDLGHLEAELCCCLVIRIENLWSPLQLFYFQLCPLPTLPRIKNNYTKKKPQT